MGRNPKTLASKRRNPQGRKSAREMAEEFHGRAVEQVINIDELECEPSDYAVIGELIELRVQDEKNEYTLEFNNKDGVILACDSEGKQLYFIGGNQNINDLLDDIETKHSLSQRFLFVGYLSGIVYKTEKHHLSDSNGEVCEYDHNFGEQGGHFPILIYDKLNEKMIIAGGTYDVRDVGIWD